MEFGISKLKNFLPWVDKTEAKAKQYFNNDKRLSFDITARRQFMATMQQDELKLAIISAENPTLPQRWLLYEIYRQTVREPHLKSQLRTNILKTMGSPFAVFKKGTDSVDEDATRLLQRPWFNQYRKLFHETPFYGHTLIEFGQLMPNKEKFIEQEFESVKLFPREHVRPETGEILIEVSDTSGIPYRKPPFNNWLLEVGEHDDLGLLLIAAKEVIWKTYSRTDWSRHSEKFGMPILAIKTASQDKKEIARLEQMANNFGSNLWVILDDQDEVEIKEATFKDSYQIYLEKAKYCDEMMSKLVNGQTGSSDVKAFAGSAEVHERTQDDFIEDNKRNETYYNNLTLFPFLIEKGYPLQDKEFRYIDIEKDGDDHPEEENSGKPKQKGNGGSPIKKPLAHGLFR